MRFQKDRRAKFKSTEDLLHRNDIESLHVVIDEVLQPLLLVVVSIISYHEGSEEEV